MTGVAKVTGKTAFGELQKQFVAMLVGWYWGAVHKAAWQNICICKAAIEITAGDKPKANGIHQDMIVKYKKWVDLLLQGGVVFGEIPEYVTENMMMTPDVKGKKKYKGQTHSKECGTSGTD